MKSLHRLCPIISLFVFAFPCFSQAFYQPGALKYQVSISLPPSQEDTPESYWKMEKDIVLYYFAHGRGKPLLVIHGGPGIPPQRSWEGLRLLDDEYRVYYYHQRGCGKSSRPVDSFESANYFENMQTLDRKLGMAALYAVEFPEHVEKMVLISPAGLLQFPPAFGGMDVVKEYLKEPQKRGYDEFIARYFDYGGIFQRSEEELSTLNRQYDLFYFQALREKAITLPESVTEIHGNGQ